MSDIAGLVERLRKLVNRTMCAVVKIAGQDVTDIDDAADALEALQERVRGLEAFKRSVDEALNSGDGSYRP